MSRRLLYALAAAVLLVAGVVAFAQDATGIPINPLRLISLVVSGDSTVGGDLTVSGDAGVSGNLSVSGVLSASGSSYQNLGVDGVLGVGTRADVALLDAGIAVVEGTLDVGGALTGGDDGASFTGDLGAYNVNADNDLRAQRRLRLYPNEGFAGDHFTLVFADDGTGAMETTPWGVRAFVVGTVDAGSYSFVGGPGWFPDDWNVGGVDAGVIRGSAAALSGGLSVSGTCGVTGDATFGSVVSFSAMDGGSGQHRLAGDLRVGATLGVDGALTCGGLISGNIDAGLVHTQTLIIQPVTSGNPTCSGGLAGANTNKFVSQAASGSTTATYYCNGDQWLFVGAPQTHCVTAASVAVSAGQSLGTMPKMEGASILLRSCTFTVTTVGSGAGDIVYTVNHVASDGGVVSQLCKVPVPCTQADTTDVAAGCAADAGIPGVWSGSISNAQRVKLSIDTSACGSRPSGEFCCSYNLGVPALPL